MLLHTHTSLPELQWACLLRCRKPIFFCFSLALCGQLRTKPQNQLHQVMFCCWTETIPECRQERRMFGTYSLVDRSGLDAEAQEACFGYYSSQSAVLSSHFSSCSLSHLTCPCAFPVRSLPLLFFLSEALTLQRHLQSLGQKAVLDCLAASLQMCQTTQLPSFPASKVNGV